MRGEVGDMEIDHKCIQEERIRALETGTAETRVYVKLIREDLAEIKDSLKEIRGSPEQQEQVQKRWQSVVMELLKLLGVCLAIFASIFGAIKLFGG
ncbi:MAG: hypothetical protein WCQ41_09415 [Bacillota bacterium]